MLYSIAKEPYQLLPLILVLALGACSKESAAPLAAPSPAQDVHLVKTATVRSDHLGFSSVHTGTLRARREVKVFNQEEGTITAMRYYEGDRVRGGTALVTLDGALLQVQLDKAAATRRQAETDLARLKELVKKKLAAEDLLARAETALQVARSEEALLRTRLGYTVIHAPFDGVVTARLAEPGDAVPRHTHLMTVADPASLITAVTVSELLLPALAIGDKAGVRIDALGAQEFSGRIERIHPTVDPNTRQGVVEVVLDPVPSGARAGQLSRVTLTASLAPRLVIPFEALQRDQNGEFVFILDQDGKARRRTVRSGLRLADQAEILEGLETGQQVVVKGFLGLSDGKQVKLAGM